MNIESIPLQADAQSAALFHLSLEGTQKLYQEYLELLEYLESPE